VNCHLFGKPSRAGAALDQGSGWRHLSDPEALLEPLNFVIPFRCGRLSNTVLVPKKSFSPNEDESISDRDGWLRAWIAPGTIQRAALNARFGPKVSVKEGIGSKRLIMWKPRRIELETNSSTEGWVMINQLSYQTWRRANQSRKARNCSACNDRGPVGSASAARKSVDSGLHPHQFCRAPVMMAKRIEYTAVRNLRF
jgi:hypothetical protein